MSTNLVWPNKIILGTIQAQKLACLAPDSIRVSEEKDAPLMALSLRRLHILGCNRVCDLDSLTSVSSGFLSLCSVFGSLHSKTSETVWAFSND